MPENTDAANIYLTCRKQHRLGPRGDVDIDFTPVLGVIDLVCTGSREDKRRCFELVIMAYRKIMELETDT